MLSRVILLALASLAQVCWARGPAPGAERSGPNKYMIPANEYASGHSWGTGGVDRTASGPYRKGSIASSYINHFSAQSTDTSTYLYDLFDPFSNTTSSHFASTALDYTATHTSPSSFLSYLFSPLNSDHVHVIPLGQDGDEESDAEQQKKGKGSRERTIAYKEYIAARRRRDGPGSVGLDIKFGGWKVDWRGVEMEVWGADWLEGAFMREMSQTHIIVTSLPSHLDPSPPLSALSKLAGPSDPAGPTISADLATSLFVLEVNEFVARSDETVLVFDNYWRQDRELWESVQKADWSDVILDEGLKKDIIHEYKSFFASERIYKDLGVPWKRGMIYLGPPGNGKTISLKATMKDVGVPLLYVKTFHSWGDDEMGIQMIFDRARQEAPCLLVMEDLDSLITEENRSFFLNQLDGIADNDGLLLIGTTNHFDKLDPAVSNRPSRFDRKYNFPNPNRAERRAYAIYWQDKLKSIDRVDFPDELTHTFADETNDFSFAYMKEAFVSTLLLLAADEKNELDFTSVLMKQVNILRKELEAGPEEISGRETDTELELVQKGWIPWFRFWRAS